MTDLSSKVVIITGASSGIGKAYAKAFANAKSKLILAARNLEKLKSLQTELEQQGCEVFIVATDVSIESECKNLIEAAIRQFKSIDILINNAGISMRALFKDVDLKVIKQLMDTNFWGTVYCTKYALPYILQSNGSIVGVSSIAGYRGLPGRTGYSASKFAMQGFLESLRTEHLHDQLHVLVVCPGYTASNIRNTALNPEGKQQGESPLKENKLMTAEAVADATIKAIKNKKRTLILTTQGKLAVFLNKWLPGMMDKMVYNTLAKEPDSPFK